MLGATLTFKNNREVKITGNNVYTAESSTYNKEIKLTKQAWHLIIVYHRSPNRKYSKIDILNSFFDIIGDNEFFPVGYKEGADSDFFLVRQCWDSIDKLFARKLILDIPKFREKLKLQISLNAGIYEFGQVSPIIKLHEAINLQFSNLKSQDGVRNVLDLEDLNNHPHLDEVYINFENKAVFKYLCDYINEPVLNILSSIQGINLSRNKIRYLNNFRLFDGTKLQMINLKENNIQSTQDLNYLTYIKFTDLYIAGNPVCNRKDFSTFIKNTFPDLKKIDVEKNQIIPFESVSTLGTKYGIGICVENLSSMQKFNKSTEWHQIIIEHHGKYNKKEIAEAFFAFFSLQKNSSDFALCCYKRGPTEDHFLVRNNFEHLLLLMKNDLKLVMTESQEILKIRMIMNYAPFESGQVEPQKLIFEVSSNKCYNPMERCLNLDDFNSKPEMQKLYIDMSNPKIYGQILHHCGHKYLAQIVEVHLGHNNISNCKGLKALNTMEFLKVLLLNDNDIKDIEDLKVISHIRIKNLKLDGNPLCKNYDLATEYIKDVCEIFANLTVLDGVDIEKSKTVLNIKKNFICSLNAYDFTEQFVEKYFHLYDSVGRVELIEMYHEKAFFSLCFDYKPRVAIDEERFLYYNDYSRNLLKSARSGKNLFRGEEIIQKILESLPKTEHDFYSFTTDTVIQNENMIVITVTGVFKDISEDSALEPDILMGFARTFLLIPSSSKLGIFEGTIEYEIANDQFTIFNPSESKMKSSFKFVSPEADLTCIAKDNDDKIAYMTMFQQLTKLKDVWITRCLDEGNWDFESALKYFVNEMKNESIPKQAFLESAFQN